MNEYQFIVASLSTREFATFDTAATMYNMMKSNFGNPDPILKKLGKDIKVYRDLLYHSHVSACVEQITDKVTKQEWDIDRGRSKSRSAKSIKAIFTDIDQNQEGGLAQVFADIALTRMFGWQVFETPMANLGQFFAPEAIISKPHEWFTFDSEKRLLFKSRSAPQGEPVPNFQFYVTRHKPTYLNPYGVAQLAACYYPVIFEKAAWSFRTVFIESNGQAKVILKVRKGTSQEEINEMVSKVANSVQDGVIAVPEDTAADTLKVNDKASSDIYKDYKDDCERDISKAILGSTLTVQQGNVGSQALGKVHAGGLDDKITSINRMIQAMFNKIIRTIYDNSNLSGELPKFIIYEEEQIEKERAERDEVLTRAGVKFTKEHFIREYGFEEDEFDVSVPTQPGATFSKPKIDLVEPVETTFEGSDPDFEALLNAYEALRKKSLPEGQ